MTTPTDRPPAETAPTPFPVHAFLVGAAGPVVVLVLAIVLPQFFAKGDAAAAALRSGGTFGVAAAVVVSIAVGLWMTRACQAGGSAFLKPLAGGFLVKLVVLAAGTLLVRGPLRVLGNHVAFALAFVAAAFGFQMLFIRVLNRVVQGPDSEGEL